MIFPGQRGFCRFRRERKKKLRRGHCWRPLSIPVADVSTPPLITALACWPCQGFRGIGDSHQSVLRVSRVDAQARATVSAVILPRFFVVSMKARRLTDLRP